MVKKPTKRNYERRLQRALQAFIREKGYVDTYYLHDSVRFNIVENGDKLPIIKILSADYIKYHPIVVPFVRTERYKLIIEDYSAALFEWRIASKLEKFLSQK